MTSRNTVFCTLWLCFFLLPLNSARAQWIPLESGVRVNLRDVHFLNPSYGIVTGDASTVLLTTDGGATWRSVASGFKESFQSALVLGRDTLLIAGGNFFESSVYRSTDAGKNWDYVSRGIDLDQNRQWIYALDNETIFKSPNRGANWKSSTIIIGSTTVLEGLDIVNNDVGYAFGNVGGFATYSTYCYRTADGGDKWFPLFDFDYPNANGFTAAAFPHPDTGYLFTNKFERFTPGTLNQLVRVTNFRFTTENFFTGWRFRSEIVNDSMPALMTDAVFLDTRLGYATGLDGNIYKTTDGGKTWKVDYKGKTPLKRIFLLDTKTGYAVGDGGAIVQLVGSTPVSEAIPENGVRYFPNPACGALTVEVPWQGTAPAIRLFNATGQLVRQWVFSGRETLSVQGLPTGVYQLVVSRGEQVFRGKVVVGCE